MIDKHFYCVIMAGGAGVRLWPLSRTAYPKQFLEAGDSGKSFLQLTYERFSSTVPQENIIVVTRSTCEGLVMKQLPTLPKENLLLEPYGRNTAPCIAYATCVILKRDPQATVIVSPSDHLVANVDLFAFYAGKMLDYAKDHAVLMTLGITPTRPDCNFGYIQIKADCNSALPLDVKTFTEKPDKRMASVFLNSGEFLWNSGIFAWQAKVIWKEFEEHLKELFGLFEGWQDAIGTERESDFILNVYGGCEKLSIDSGIMEKTLIAKVYPAEFGWADIGSWESLYDTFPTKDEDFNATDIKELISKENSGTLMLSSCEGKLTAISGLTDYVVVDTPDVLFICPKNEKKMKDLISPISMRGYEKFK